jgi:hypothetical protein
MDTRTAIGRFVMRLPTCSAESGVPSSLRDDDAVAQPTDRICPSGDRAVVRSRADIIVA